MDYERVLQGKYPATQHAKRVSDYIREKVPGASGVLYLESRMTKLLEDSDMDEPFRYIFQLLQLRSQYLANAMVVASAATSTT